MIGKLTGEVCFIDSGQIIIDVAGVGYVVYVTSSIIDNIKSGQKLAIWIHTQVKESEITLFGFVSKEEKQLFEILITVQGVGGKVALAILSFMTIDVITNAIITQDDNAFKRVSGIGPKLAARIVNELKDKKIIKISFSSDINQENKGVDIVMDAASVLANLGFMKADAFKIAADILKKDDKINLEELIKESLNQITKTHS